MATGQICRDRRLTMRESIPLRRLALSAVLLVSAAICMQAAFFEFVYDDFGQIVYNPWIKSRGLVFRYFTTHVWAQSGDLALYYRPVYMLWLGANYALFGLNPLYWHLTAILLHLVSCLFLYLFVCHLTRDNWVAVVTVLLFGLHPAHIESVAWVSGTTESLLASLLLGSLLCYLKYRQSVKPRAVWLVASLLLASMGVFVKETALILPALIFVYEWIFHQRAGSQKVRLWSAVCEAMPYAAISFSFLVIRALALKSVTPAVTRVGRLSVLLAWPKAIAFYIGHVLFPIRLSVFYKLFRVTDPGLQNFVIPVILMLAGVAVLYYGSRRSQLFAFLSLWCAIMLVPILNVTLWDNVENVHDRYLYLPSAAVCVMLASLLSRLKELGYTKTMSWALIVVAAGYALVTIKELQYWKNDYVLAQHGMAVSPGHPIAPQLLGNAYIREGRINEAVPYLIDSLSARPDDVDTLCSLAFCYTEMNALTLAEECVTKAEALKGSKPRVHLLLGMVRFKQNRLNESETEIRRAIELEGIQKSISLYHYYLGNVLYAEGDVRGAQREYQLELSNDPAGDPAVVPAQERLEQIQRQSRPDLRQRRGVGSVSDQ